VAGVCGPRESFHCSLDKRSSADARQVTADAVDCFPVPKDSKELELATLTNLQISSFKFWACQFDTSNLLLNQDSAEPLLAPPMHKSYTKGEGHNLHHHHDTV